jgi:hypothetical protein
MFRTIVYSRPPHVLVITPYEIAAVSQPSIAQLVEHLTVDQRVLSSNLGGRTYVFAHGCIGGKSTSHVRIYDDRQCNYNVLILPLLCI